MPVCRVLPVARVVSAANAELRVKMYKSSRARIGGCAMSPRPHDVLLDALLDGRHDCCTPPWSWVQLPRLVWVAISYYENRRLSDMLHRIDR